MVKMSNHTKDNFIGFIVIKDLSHSLERPALAGHHINELSFLHVSKYTLIS